MVIDTEGTESGSGDVLFTTSASMFLPGAGGWGGDRGPSGERNTPPVRSADHSVSFETRADQALLYRMSGDRNPLHSDPQFAKVAGFPKPILHGLCSYGITGRLLLHTLCGSDPARFSSWRAASQTGFPRRHPHGRYLANRPGSACSLPGPHREAPLLTREGSPTSESIEALFSPAKVLLSSRDDLHLRIPLSNNSVNVAAGSLGCLHVTETPICNTNSPCR